MSSRGHIVVAKQPCSCPVRCLGGCVEGSVGLVLLWPGTLCGQHDISLVMRQSEKNVAARCATSVRADAKQPHRQILRRYRRKCMVSEKCTETNTELVRINALVLHCAHKQCYHESVRPVVYQSCTFVRCIVIYLHLNIMRQV